MRGGGYRHVENLLVRQKKRKELGMELEDFVIMSIGELNENKNHRVIIEAIDKLKDPKIKFIICGQGGLQKELQELINKKKLKHQVKLLGFRDDIKELLHASDVFALPSKREGLGLAAIEAMAAGLPLITSNIHGIKDYLSDGEGGFSCSPKSVEAFAEAISYCFGNMLFRKKAGEYNQVKSTNFDKIHTENIMKKIYMVIRDL